MAGVRKHLFTLHALGWTLAPSWTAGVFFLAGLPVMIIELMCISPMLSAAALMESSIDDKSFCRTYMKMWNEVVCGSDEPISTTKGVFMAIAAYLTSPLGMLMNTLIVVMTIFSLGES